MVTKSINWPGVIIDYFYISGADRWFFFYRWSPSLEVSKSNDTVHRIQSYYLSIDEWLPPTIKINSSSFSCPTTEEHTSSIISEESTLTDTSTREFPTTGFTSITYVIILTVIIVIRAKLKERRIRMAETLHYWHNHDIIEISTTSIEFVYRMLGLSTPDSFRKRSEDGYDRRV